jgi:hypothetical protein
MGAKTSRQMEHALSLYESGLTATSAAKIAGVHRVSLYQHPKYKVLRDQQNLRRGSDGI